MLADVHELIRSSLTNAMVDQKVTSAARADDRSAFQAALEAARDRLEPPDEQLQKHLVAADEALKKEQLDDDETAALLAHSVPGALAKLAELASL
jgi:hypothetical protein